MLTSDLPRAQVLAHFQVPPGSSMFLHVPLGSSLSLPVPPCPSLSLQVPPGSPGWGGRGSLACCLVQAQGVMDELVLLPRLDHPTSAQKHTD